MSRKLSALALAFCSFISSSVLGAEPNFEKIRPDALYTNYQTGYYPEGSTPCQDIADANNSQPGRMWDYLSSAYNSTPGDEGCDYILRRLSDGYTISEHYYGWVAKHYFCPYGYTGPYGDESSGRECQRHPYVPVAKQQICPSCVVGNPIDIPAADKILTVEDIPVIGGLGFQRSYRSGPGIFHEGQPASLGLAWSSDHAQVMRFLPADDSFAAKAHMVRSDGRPLMFQKSDATGLWVSERDDLRYSLAEVALESGDPGEGVQNSV